MAVDPLPRPPLLGKPPQDASAFVNAWRQQVEGGLAGLLKWPRAGMGFFEAAPTVNDDETFGYERGFLWVALVGSTFLAWVAWGVNPGAADWRSIVPEEVLTSNVLSLARQYALSSGGGSCFGAAPNADDDMLAWLVDYGGTTYQAVFAARGTDNRWRHVAALPLDNSTTGQTLKVVTAPAGYATALIYVPHNGNSGLGHGKWWMANSSNHTLRIIEPSDLSYTDYTIGGANNDVTAYSGLRYSADLDRVFWLNGNTVNGGDRFTTVKPSDMTLDKESTGWSDVRGWDLETAGGVTSKVWLAEFTSGTNALWTLDATDISAAAVDTNVNVVNASWPLIYLPDVDSVVLVTSAGTAIQVVDADSYATFTYNTGLSAAASGTRAAYIAELHGVVIGTASDFNVFDTRFPVTPAGATATTVMLARIYGGSDWLGNKQDVFYSADFRELYVGTAGRDELWVLF